MLVGAERPDERGEAPDTPAEKAVVIPAARVARDRVREGRNVVASPGIGFGWALIPPCDAYDALGSRKNPVAIEPLPDALVSGQPRHFAMPPLAYEGLVSGEVFVERVAGTRNANGVET